MLPLLPSMVCRYLFMHFFQIGRDMPSKDEVSLLVVYASQQGNAQAIAEDLHEELLDYLKQKEVTLGLKCISELGKKPDLLIHQDCLIFIAATTGITVG